MKEYTLSGKIVDIISRRIFPGVLLIREGRIVSVRESDDFSLSSYILPGFIDAHVHIESSMVTPSEFARMAVVHGTVASISDPHEIANVLGVEGVRYMIRNGQSVPFHFYFGAPSCVPATIFESAGSSITTREIEQLFYEEGLLYLSEMMNYPAVLQREKGVMEKIEIAMKLGKAIDGHAPGIKGEEALKYSSAGITTDHECFTLEEALDKIAFGMKILIREGSAAKNYQALHSLIATHPDKVMFCSDDKHPDDLLKGHINQIVKRSIIDHGYDTMDVLRCSCYNPLLHYKLDIGLLREGDSADLIVVDNLRDFNVQQNYIRGCLVAEKGKTVIPHRESAIVNAFAAQPIKVEEVALKATGSTLRVIVAEEGELITKKAEVRAKVIDGHFVSDTERDLLKLIVINRYHKAPPAIAFVRGFQLQKGALASSIAHDSHNIIAVGTTDEEICQVVNGIIACKGGIAIVTQQSLDILPLPLAGIMSIDDGYSVARDYTRLSERAKELGTTLHSPFMALLVIPSLKLSDKGLFDGERFCFTPLICG